MREKEREKILVTGADGFVAGAVIDELKRAQRFSIDGLVNRNRKRKPARNEPEFRAFEVDIASAETFPGPDVLGNTDYVIHCAGLAHQFGEVSAEAFQSVNVAGTLNVCRLARQIGVGRIILLSSVAVYGDYGEREVDESFVCRPAGHYAESKWAAEQTAREFCERHQIGLTILRLATVIGAGDRGNVSRLITQIDRRRFIWIGTGSNKKTLIDKTDAAKAIRRVIESFGRTKADGIDVYNLAAEPVTMKEIVEAISKNLKKRVLPLRIPEKAVRRVIGLMKNLSSAKKLARFDATVEKWLSNDLYSGRKFYGRFDFVPQAAIPESISRQVQDYLNRKGKNEVRQE